MTHNEAAAQVAQAAPQDHAPSSYRLAVAAAAVADDAAAAVPMHSSGGMTPLQRWSLSASDAQFNALAGAIGGFTSGIVTCPLDVIKTKLQAQGGFHLVDKGRHVGHPKLYNGLVGTARVILREEGIRGLYRGLGPIVLGYLPTWAVWFTVYNKSKVFLHQYHDNQHLVNFWSSIIAGGSSTIVTNPIWVIKTRLMSQSNPNSARAHFAMLAGHGNTPTTRPSHHAPWHYRSTLDAARKMYTSEGLASFYSGLTPALLGLSHVAVQFPAYEFLKKQFTGQGMGEVSEKGGSADWVGILSASILSKILASSATYPHEVIRTRLQTQRRPVAGEQFLHELDLSGSGLKQLRPKSPKYRGIVMTCRTILHEEGWRAFYAGMGTNMMRAVPAATVTMLTYEYVMRELNKTRHHALEKLQEGSDAEP
ncbi:Mitochondrial nicotinamide adenine dinucleotide transporter 1 [Escovopsis weberi]|uniref:Mitochondrial nicotinamide adenine dinucleotide transporter 1 n=1 Tax=Escovopsis weberi TaxID=150374 RepID=A0A0M9VX44_ESCWE|nr:Mitochondrial nicotinamide adenine dinucleotide transporter 1 [Escovopsis weberi]